MHFHWLEKNNQIPYYGFVSKQFYRELYKSVMFWHGAVLGLDDMTIWNNDTSDPTDLDLAVFIVLSSTCISAAVSIKIFKYWLGLFKASNSQKCVMKIRLDVTDEKS